jgi:hypothetical protein
MKTLRLISGVLFLLFFVPNVFAEFTLIDQDNWTLGMSVQERTDAVALKNTVDLDSRNSDDTSTYLGIDYNLSLSLKAKDEEGPSAFIKLERNGPYDYDAPIAIHNTLITSTDRVERYRDAQLLPGVEEFWLDLPLGLMPARLKGGLFAYEVGHGISLGGAYEQFGALFSLSMEPAQWRLYWAYPDAVNENYWGPRLEQEELQGIDYSHDPAQLISTDLKVEGELGSLQGYVGMLLDSAGDKRTNNFTAPVDRDLLGTAGVSLDTTWKKLSLALEAAKNFGQAHSADDSFEDVVHKGYALYASSSYDAAPFTPRIGLLFASGNKADLDAAAAGELTLTSGSNRAFSVFSPLNADLADSIYSNFPSVPIVAMGNGYGLNYGVGRPTTNWDPITLDNLLLINAGTDLALGSKTTISFDYYYLRSAEAGVGTWGGAARHLSHDLGHELDMTVEFAFNDNVSLGLLGGYFFPGDFYRELRDDTGGSVLTPFVRGDGEADRAYQVELSLSISF